MLNNSPVLSHALGWHLNSTRSILHDVGLQESRETLLRLKRMAGFESQNFDPIVSLLPLTVPHRRCILAASDLGLHAD